MFRAKGFSAKFSVLLGVLSTASVLAAAVPPNVAGPNSNMGVYTAKGELELYTGIEFPISASNYYCHLTPSSEMTIIARFDVPSEALLILAKRSPKIPMPYNNSLNSDLRLSSVIEPYQDQAWFASLIDSDYLLSDRCHGREGDQAWSTRLFASFIDDQTLRIYLIHSTSRRIFSSTEMVFYTGIKMPALATNYHLKLKRVGLYKKTLNTSVRFDLPQREGCEFIQIMKNYFHFEEDHNAKWEYLYVQDLFEISGDTASVKESSKTIFRVGHNHASRFGASIAGVVFKDETVSFYFDFYEVVGFRNKIEALGRFLDIHLSRHVTNVQTHLVWHGDGKLIRFDVPKAELKDILVQLEKDVALSVLEKDDRLKDRIAGNHGLVWWHPEQLHDMTWCIKNNGRLFIAGGTIEGRDCATVFVKYYDVGF